MQTSREGWGVETLALTPQIRDRVRMGMGQKESDAGEFESDREIYRYRALPSLPKPSSYMTCSPEIQFLTLNQQIKAKFKDSSQYSERAGHVRSMLSI